VRAARDRGCAVLFVTHNLDEVLAHCDTVSILRDGHLVAEGAVADLTESDLITAIVGRAIGDLYPPQATVAADRPVALAVRGLSGGGLSGVDLDLHEGEILGVTGLAGMGQDALPLLLYGASRAHGGEVRLADGPLRLDPREALRRGVVLVPADRKSLGGDMAASIEQNLTLPVLGRYWRRGRLDRAGERNDVISVLARFDVRPAEPQRLLGQLSGGNQQKALLGKWIELYGQAKVLLLHEPTQGVDVGARQEIFRFIREAADRGASILYVSTEHEDLAHLCDRVLIVRDGAFVAELHAPLDPDAIVARSLASAPATPV
jgi:ribose transport system ATP-binding protein